VFQAVIFDMDGVLIDSEPLWHQAEQHILGGLGIDFNKPPLLQSTGLTTASVIAHWYQHQPWPGPTPEQVHQTIIDFVASGVAAHGEPKTGLLALLADIKARQLKIAVATNSPQVLLDTTLAQLDIADYFQVRCHIELVSKGKPDPEIYLLAASKLGVKPEHCLVFEDSFAGVTAAKAAGMTVVAIPAEHEWQHSKFAIADAKIRCFSEFATSNYLR
jgi:mannitol-1-/sugar-/sorbitol-6-/2-deoxyglucose-6-phosphatase